MTTRLDSALPSSSDRDLVTAALEHDPVKAAAGWHRWRDATTVADSPPHTHALLAMVADTVPHEELGTEASTLRGLRRRAWAVNQRLRARWATLESSLRERGIPAELVRGSAFLLPPSETFRPISRLDIQVPADAWATTARYLIESGWRIKEPRSRSDSGLLLESDDLVSVNLTWAPGFPTALRRPMKFTSSDPASRAQRAVLAIVEGMPSPPYAPLLWPVDVSVLVTSGPLAASSDPGVNTGGEFTWQDVTRTAAEARVSPLIGTALDWLSRTIGAPIPASVLSELATGPMDRWLMRRLERRSTRRSDADAIRRRLDMLSVGRRLGVDTAFGAPARTLSTLRTRPL